MKAIKFTHPDHYLTLIYWARERQSHIPTSEEMPQQGIVILNDNQEPICMGFIRRIEGGLGMIDGYISDKNAPAIERNEALSLLTEEIINLSKELGLSGLLAITVDAHTLERSLKHGFSALPHALMFKDLRK